MRGQGMHDFARLKYRLNALVRLLHIACLMVISQSLWAQQSDPDITVPPLPLQEPAGEESQDSFSPVIKYDADGQPLDPCAKFDAQYESWLDRSQIGLYKTVCGTAAWFDGFFGDSRYDEKTGDTYGRLSLGGFYDRRDSFDERIRFRGKFAFPAMRARGSVFIVQGDEDSVIKGSG